MKLVVISLDPGLADPFSPVSLRQKAYFAGHEAVCLVFARGERIEWAEGGVRTIRVGGSNKFQMLVRGLDELWRQSGVDRVVVQAPDVLGLCGWVYARLYGARYLVQDHAGIAARAAFGVREYAWRPVARWLLCSADAVRTVSERAARGLRDWGLTDDRLTIIPITEDLSPFFQINRRPSVPSVIACVARLEPEKGIDVLLRAFARLRRHDVVLQIAGGGSDRPKLEALARELDVASCVRWLGSLPRERVLELFASARFYVQPSYFEGWGMALIEAAAAGLPIVSTDVGCIGEVLRPDVEALVMDSGDDRGLAEAMERLFNDEALAQQLGRAARARAQRLPSVSEARGKMRQWLLTEVVR